MDAYVAGVNAYIDASDKGRYFPGEYVLTGHKDAITNAGTIEHFKRSDLIALASVIGSLFGAGGGGEVNNALSLLAAQEKYGVAEGTEVWESFRQRNDPEAVLTQQDGSFPYLPTPDDPQGLALPDAGSVEPEPLVYDRTGSAGAAGATGASAKSAEAAVTSARRGMSNALVVSGEHTASGHPVAVFGPQTGYFAPQLLMLQEIQGPGISARGASFAGLSMYVELGRGQDYAWSATTSGQDIIDTYAVELCQDDYHYLYRGTCTPMEKVERHNAWRPTVADSTAAGSYTMRVWRTKYGPVESRATVGGKKVAYTTLRSSYLHEADSIIGFQMLNDPDYLNSPERFQAPSSTSTTPSTGSTPTPSTPRTTTAATTRCGPTASTPSSRSGPGPRTSGRAGTRPTTPPGTPARPPTRSRSTRTTTSPGTTSRPGTTRPPPGATAPSTAATCSTTG